MCDCCHGCIARTNQPMLRERDHHHQARIGKPGRQYKMMNHSTRSLHIDLSLSGRRTESIRFLRKHWATRSTWSVRCFNLNLCRLLQARVYKPEVMLISKPPVCFCFFTEVTPLSFHLTKVSSQSNPNEEFGPEKAHWEWTDGLTESLGATLFPNLATDSKTSVYFIYPITSRHVHIASIVAIVCCIWLYILSSDQ